MLRAASPRVLSGPALALCLAVPACRSPSGAAPGDAGPVVAPASAAEFPGGPSPSVTPAISGPAADTVTTTVLVEGTGPAVRKGDKVALHYVGTLLDGSKFASSRDSNKPLVFTVGERGIVRGMSLGVVGMKVGEKRKIVVPPSLAYGERSNAKIPPNSTLVYEVELLGIEPK